MDKGGNMAEGEQQLFLMEFLVDRVNVPTVRAMQEKILPSTTCVSFQILNLPPINIHQSNPLTDCACPPISDNATATPPTAINPQIFKKGKSCLFALPTIVLEKPLFTFPVTMSVYKNLPPDVLPDVMLIGSHQIELKDLINSLIKDYVFIGGNPSKNIKNTFKIKTATGQPIGSVTVFLRVSCFGKKIVTQFQIPHNQKPYLFKGAENGPTFQCNKIADNGKSVTDGVTTQDSNSSSRGLKPPLLGGVQTLKSAAEKMYMHPNSLATSDKRCEYVFGESPINNMRKCGCHRT